MDDNGKERALSIAYDAEYQSVMAAFWRALEGNISTTASYHLTTAAIELCEGNYTAWRWRRELVSCIPIDLMQEVAFVRAFAAEHPKNYQLWHHRQAIIGLLLAATSAAGGEGEERRGRLLSVYKGEVDDLARVLLETPKNYHAWQYRSWLFGSALLGDGTRNSLFPPEDAALHMLCAAELSFVEECLLRDPFNNSAWSYRHFLLQTHLSARSEEAKASSERSWYAREAALVGRMRSLSLAWQDEPNESVEVFAEALLKLLAPLAGGGATHAE